MLKTNQRITTQLFFILVVSSLLFACTTERDGLVYRWYHNTTANYNGFFYAKESMKEAKAKLKEAYTEDYDEILPVFIYGDEQSAQSVYGQLERAIEKSSKVVDRHTMKVSKRNKRKMEHPEMNKWIDDNYLIIGQGYFYKRNYYKAEEIFKYCSRKFKENKTKAAAGTWLARVYIEIEEYPNASNELLKVSQIKNIDDELLADYHLVHGDYYIRQGDYKKAESQIESALMYIKKKRDRARPTFILAQLNQKLENSQKAIDLYETVLKLKPEYEMAFYAQINQAMAFSRRGGNSTIIKEKLAKMLRDDKNYEYRDQIYYAMATILLEERERTDAVDNLEMSLKVNEGNDKQRGKSYLKLADVHFEDRNYRLAQAYYDSTSGFINEEHPRFKDIVNKAESLTELVENLLVIEREDSLQQLAQLSPEALDTRLDEIIKQLEEERERRRQAEEAARLAALEGKGVEGGTWAFYNPALLASGYQNFKDVWGDRLLEDDWRRSSKLSISNTQEEEEIPEEELAQETEDPKDEIPSKEELMAGIPKTAGDLQASDAKLSEAYYNAGLIYKEKLDDFENAVEAFEILADRFEESEYHVIACYQLYRAYLAKELEGYQNPFCGTCNSKYWGDIVVSKYPDTEYALLIQNPEYKSLEAKQRAEEVEAYGNVLEMYRMRRYNEVLIACNEVIKNEPSNHLIPKYYFLKAMATGGMDSYSGQRDNYIAALEEVMEKFPDTEEYEKADEMLKILRGNFESGPQEDPEVTEDSPFIFDADADHYFIVIFTKGTASFNAVKASISDFNSNLFTSENLKTSSNLLDREHHLVLVKNFDNQAMAENYYRAFIANEEFVADINTDGFTKLLISKKNYVTLFKEKLIDEYVSFFEANYLN